MTDFKAYLNEKPHWADPYRNAPGGSLENKIYLAACYIMGDEAHVRQVGQFAFDHQCGIWHAASIIGGRLDTCPCSPCMKARKAVLGFQR